MDLSIERVDLVLLILMIAIFFIFILVRTPSSFQPTKLISGGTYPLEIYVFVNRVENLATGIYHYESQKHSLVRLKEGDFKEQIYSAALSQSWVEDSAVVFVYSAVPKRTTERYGERGMQYIFIEVGHASQNLLLETVSLGLGAVPIGAFDDKQLNSLIGIDGENEKVVYINAVGRID